MDVPPNNLNAERSVLGAVLLDQRHLNGLIALGLRAEHFYREQLGFIYVAMLELDSENEAVDVLTVVEVLKRHDRLEFIGGPGAVDELAGWVPASGHAKEYGVIVRDLAQRREVIAGTHAIHDAAMKGEKSVADLLSYAEQRMGTLSGITLSDLELLPFDAELERAERVMTGVVDNGLPTGYNDLDHLVGGWQAENLIVLAARPGMGKSALVVNLAEGALKAGTAVAMFSLEMSRSEILRRLLACNAGVQGEHLLRGPLTEQQFVKVVDATTMIANWEFFVDEAVDASIYDIRSRARRLHNRLPKGLGLIIVDYLQLLRPLDARGNRTQEVAAMTRGLKTLAKELRIPVICVSQLNRDLEKRADRRPQLSDLRDSGAVEQDADMVLFLYREGYYDKDVDPSVTELNIAKHRNGRLGQVDLTFLAHYPKFTPSAAAVNTEAAIPF